MFLPFIFMFLTLSTLILPMLIFYAINKFFTLFMLSSFFKFYLYLRMECLDHTFSKLLELHVIIFHFSEISYLPHGMAFHHCDKIPKINNCREERLISGHSFGGFSLCLLNPVLGMWQDTT